MENPDFVGVMASWRLGVAAERKAGSAFVVRVAEEAIGTSFAA